VLRIKRHRAPLEPGWTYATPERPKRVMIAMGNKLAQIAWSVLSSGEVTDHLRTTQQLDLALTPKPNHNHALDNLLVFLAPKPCLGMLKSRGEIAKLIVGFGREMGNYVSVCFEEPRNQGNHVVLILSRYAMAAGISKSTSVPAPGLLHIFKCAAIRVARSCIPGRPQCPPRRPSTSIVGSIP